MGVWRLLAMAPKAAPWESDVSLQGEFSSGDDDPSDGVYGTFDPLYGARKKFLGMMNLIGRRNLKSLRTAWEAHPRDNLRLRAKLFQYWLASRRDGLYSMSGRRLLSVAPGGAAAGRIGSELDFEVRFKPLAYLTVDAGVGRFFAGPFVREASRRNPPGSPVWIRFSRTEALSGELFTNFRSKPAVSPARGPGGQSVTSH